MNLLFLTPQLPYPPRQGTAIRNWGLIRHLSARHAISLLSFMEEGQTIDDALRATCRRVVTVPAPQRSRAARLRTLIAREPDLAQRLASVEFARALAGLLREEAFDLVHIEGLELARYLPLIRSVSPATKRLYDAHNAEYVLQRRASENDRRAPARWPAALYSWLQWPRLKRFEALTLRAAHAVTCVSADDAAALRALVPELTPVLVPNGIDVDSYAVGARGWGAGASPQPLVPSILFTGKMDYRPNVDAVLWFAKDIWPRIHAHRLEAQFMIVGQRPTAPVRRLHGQQGIVVTGAVEDVRPHLAAASVYAAPLRMGGGTRFKLLEAMALARPIVSTTLGAEGFAVRSGRELLLADAPEAFAEAVLSLLADPARAQALGEAGRAFVAAHYDWSVIVPILEALYLRIGL